MSELKKQLSILLQSQAELYGEVNSFNEDELKSALPQRKNKSKTEIPKTPTTKSIPLEPSASAVHADIKRLLPNNLIGVYESLQHTNTLAELLEICKHSDQLKTDLLETNIVFGNGLESADLMIIGEAPGEEENKQGIPFVGAAGQLLDKILQAINFSRSQVYVANILKHRPPNNRNPTREECQRSIPFLLRQIELVNPKLILCLGKVSGGFLLSSETTLSNLRTQAHSFLNRELYVTYHPSALLRNPQWKHPTWEDVQKVRSRYDELACKP